MVTESKRNNSKQGSFIYYFLAFVLPIFILLITYYFIGIAPFGEKSILTIDLRNQYISFYSYLSDVLHGSAGPFYSFSNGLGGEMVNLSAYYLMSPFNVLFYFSSIESLPFFIFVLTILKTALASLAMFYYLSKKTNNYKLAILGGIAYALMSYMIVFQSNLIWLDNIIYFPLIIHGLDEILKGKKSYVYLIFLTLSIITQYYIAFMICIFLLLYFVIKVIELYWDGNFKSFFKRSYKSFKYFLVESILAAGISAILLFPLIFSFTGGASEGRIDISKLLSFEKNFDFKEFLSKFFIGSFNYNQVKTGGLPNVYTTLLTLPGIMLFYFNSFINWRRKISVSVLILVLYFSMYFEGPNILWHGITSPIWFPYRYSFIFIFILITCAVAGIHYLITTDINRKKVVTILIVSILLSVAAAITIYHEEFDYLNKDLIIWSVIFVTLYCLALSFSRLERMRPLIFFTVLCLMGAELTFNNVTILSEMSYFPLEEYNQHVQKTIDILNKLPKEDIYRLEKDYSLNNNDPLLYNYSGLSHYSSSDKAQDKEFLGRLGYRNNGNWAIYGNGSSTQADSLLGLRFVLSSSKHLPYDYLFEYDSTNVYENKFALPLGFLVDGDKALEPLNSYGNPLDYTNAIYKKLGSQGNVLERIPEENINIQLENVKLDRNESNVYKYTRVDEDEPAFIHFTLNELKDEPIQFFFQTEYFDGARVFVDDEYIGRSFDRNHHTVDSARSSDETTTVSLELINDELKYENSYFYTQSTEAFLDVVNNLQEESFDIEKLKDGYILGDIQTNEMHSSLVLSVPFDENWQIKVNDTKVEPKNIFKGLTLIELPPNQYVNIEMRYVPKGLIVGSLISIIFLGIGWKFFTKDQGSYQ